ncbi:MAG: hypothetical protein ABIB43_05525 [archaeon]
MFDILKKKKAEEVVITSTNQNPEQLREELLRKQDIPSLEDIPLPPAQEDIPVPPPLEKPLTKTMEPEEMPSIKSENNVVVSNKKTIANTDSSNPEIPTGFEQPTNEFEESDFTLPDFSEEELEVEEEMGSPEEIVQPKEPKIEPVIQTPTIDKSVSKYFKTGDCAIIFENLDKSKQILMNSINEFQKLQTRNKRLIQDYKEYHNNLDLAQEKLMQIDVSLFEG